MDNELTKRILSIIRNNVNGGLDFETLKGYIYGDEQAAELIAKECEKVAIEFTRSVLRERVFAYYGGKLGVDDNKKDVTSPQFSLKLGDLTMHGNKKFNEFINTNIEWKQQF